MVWQSLVLVRFTICEFRHLDGGLGMKPEADIDRTMAITPSKSRALGFDEVRRVCQTCTLAGLQAMHESSPSKPFRFLYMSGIAAERDQTKKPDFMPEYSWMRVSAPRSTVFSSAAR